MNFALQGAGLAIATCLSDWDELNYRLLPAGYNDFFASAGFLDEAGKLSFRFVKVIVSMAACRLANSS